LGLLGEILCDKVQKGGLSGRRGGVHCRSGRSMKMTALKLYEKSTLNGQGESTSKVEKDVSC